MPLRSRCCAFRSWSRAPFSTSFPSASPVPFGGCTRSASSGSSDPPDLELARAWLNAFESGVKTIPRHVGQISFSRSSGPGGQNVNKVNSKATLKVPLAALLPLVPRLLHPELRASRYATDRSQALVIQSDESRQQASNVDACYAKLHQLLASSAKAVIPGETSREQKDRVSKLQRAQNEARLKSKKFHSSKKSNRQGSKYDD
ncbi:uncharacterized protein N7482_000577 [Penicillium canariense]|uniref:Prokaryotic-type class I peptide chain release factors domain-containing protein n=1 Tax=Penicillium canariense TaxID=189055 RepID=A0A9W9IET6_9EURO|nr:uncharacterized protein N7482_000577 [Penicillium canariense]KAJ5174700.1 hypothetical protein N7482_000577 [Penicillium canariense]